VNDFAREPPIDEPPHSIEAEQSVLGALLLDNASAKESRGLITADDFYSAAHRLIFEHIDARIREGVPADAVLVADSLQGAGKLEYIGGLAYLGALVENVPTAANIRSYAGVVRDRAELRRMAAIGLDVHRAAMHPALRSVDEIRAEAREALAELATQGGRDGMSTYSAAQLVQRPQVERAWIVDQWLPARTNAAIAGHGGTGKSMLMTMLTVCVGAGVPFYGLAVSRGPVLFYSCEDDVDECVYRMRRAAAHIRVDLEGLPITIIDALDSGADPALFAPPPDNPRALAMLTPAGVRLSEMVEVMRPALVVLDSATDAFGGDEIRRREVRRYLRAMQRALAAWGPCVLHVLHVDKIAARGAATTDLYSGSTDWNNGVRARLAFYRPRPPGDEDEGGADSTADALLRLELQKANYAKGGAFIDLRYDEAGHTFVRAGGSVAAAGDIVSSIRRQADERNILRALVTAEDARDPVFSAERSNRNAAIRLKAMDALPATFRGRAGAPRLFALLLRFKADGLIAEDTIRNASRHPVTVWRVTAAGRSEATGA
jgi:RecA-family ATPase